MGRELFDQRQEVGVEQHRRRAAVDDRVGDVLGNEADVHRLHHRAHHRDGEVAFVIAVAVPFEDGDDVALVDADLGEAARKPADALAKLPVGPAAKVAVDDLLIGRARHRRMQKMLDEQGIGVGRRRRRNDLDRHGDPSIYRFSNFRLARLCEGALTRINSPGEGVRRDRGATSQGFGGAERAGLRARSAETASTFRAVGRAGRRRPTAQRG